MADAEIQVLITVVDEMSAKLDKIERGVSDFSKTTAKETEKVNSAFETQIKGLVAIGNVAHSADNILSSYQNLQIRLENATERVSNAEDRLFRAQRNLNDVMSDSTSTINNQIDAQMELDSATRGLTIAQNGLEKANNAVVGTYISMGVNTLLLISSIPAAVASITTMIATVTALEVALVAATVAVAALIAAYARLQAKKAKDYDTMGNTNLGEGKFVDIKPSYIPPAVLERGTRMTNGPTVNVNGPIYGINAVDISKALSNELNYSVSA